MLIVSLFFSNTLYEYKYKGVVIFRSLDININPFFEYSEVKKRKWKPFAPKLIKIKDGRKKLILIHGISPREIDEEIDFYKENMINAFKEECPEDVGIYFFLYPSLNVPLEETAKKLVELTKNFDNFYVYAHSMGGLLLRYALQYVNFSKKVNMIVFAGTPHLGSPLAQLCMVDGNYFKIFQNRKIELIKVALVMANFFKGYIVAPNYKYLFFGNSYLEIPDGVKVVNFVGHLDFSISDFDKILDTNIPSFIGLYFLKYVMDNFFPENSVFLENDGMVPVVSAQACGETNVYFKATHADLAMRRDIIKKVFEVFGL
ncbi:hypothetical protein Tmel_1912 [Thermosipho melanesiensis BI429]|uniref:GPI inositol-deacylase PGAP1-like alpha/beta domain-containing protein n=1 Tax=Thermosipho melanesiensis (strain DSM 12029 / CIP 104789 / BI429) TaxID=391009 RepID=A6LP93_THEM4|nr:hypothetical protein Tmel_1912 [Thermosipho melanesiensis BI429]